MNRLSLGLVASGLAFTSLVVAPTTASAAPHRSVHDITCALRSEIDALTYNAKLLLADCRDYRDVTNELADLCRDLDRLERELRRPIRTHHQLERLGHLAHRVDDEACDLQEEIGEAIRWMQRYGGHRHFDPRPHRASRLPVLPPSRARGLTFHLGGGSSRFAINFGGRGLAHRVSYAPQVAAPPQVSLHELECSADRIRGLTRQLVAILCH